LISTKRPLECGLDLGVLAQYGPQRELLLPDLLDRRGLLAERPFVQRPGEERHELLHVDRLRQVLAGAGLQGVDSRLQVGVGGEDEDRQVGIALSQAACDFDAGQAGHHQVGDDSVGRLLGPAGEELLVGLEHLVAELTGLAEVGGQQLRVGDIVVEDVDFRYHKCNI
jgi:hypothetical protein